MKQDVLAMLPRSVELPDTAAETPTGDAEPTTVEQDADEPADPAAEPPAADEPVPTLNGVHADSDGDLLEPICDARARNSRELTRCPSYDTSRPSVSGDCGR
jgi:hypothetical protein